MALPLIMGGLQLVGSIAGDITASENAETQAKIAYNNMNIRVNNLQQTAEELNKQVGLELTNAKFDEMKAVSSVAGHQADSGITGQTASRIAQSVEIKGMQFRNQIKQRAEANTVKLQTDMKNATDAYASEMVDISVDYSNSTDSAFGMLAKAGTAYYGAV